MSEGFGDSPAEAWAEVSGKEYDEYWAAFESRFRFHAGVSPDAWPAIREPAPSVTFDLSVIADGPRRAAACDAINAEALRAFVWALPDTDLVVLNWNHAAYHFSPASQALVWQSDWRVPVFPNGDYYAFLTQDLLEGTFGHPWEQTLCVIGERLVASLGRSLETWLPIKRRDGMTA